MICELCGKTVNEGFKVRLEGSVVSACADCAKHGDVVAAVRQQAKPKAKPKPAAVVDAAEADVKAPAEYELVEDYGIRVKAAREKRGWTQDDLGKAVNEAHSLIHRIELGRFEPSVALARNLEGRLGIRLVVRKEELEVPSSKQEVKDITLGDLVVVRKRNK